MICTRLWAQLGNQCFMLAAAIAHAKKMDTYFGAPRKSLDPRVWPTYFPGLPEARVTLHYYKESKHSYDPLPQQNDLTIEGYFQSEKYFEDAKEEVAQTLAFKYDPHPYVAIHVRRGDYLLYPDRFPVLTIGYYRQAIELMGAHDYCKFKIYSDDIPWCKQNINNDMEINKMAFNCFLDITYSEIKDPVKDMKDMYNASAFIISNSTFSLFPALLRQDNPLVIAPAENRWYGQGAGLDTSTLMPERFIKL